MSRPILSTDRIRLEPLTAEHTDLLVELDSDPEVLRHVFGRALSRAEVLDTWLPRRLRPDAAGPGRGYWVGFDAAGDFLGWWALVVDDADPQAAELGYRLRRDAWGRGLATEGARAVVTHAFADLGLDRLWATTMAVNAGSRSVLATAGLLETGIRTDDPWPYPVAGRELGVVEASLTRAQWERQTSWDAEAPAYDEPADHGLRDPACRAAWRDLLDDALPPTPARVADLGCGTATLSLLLAGEGHHVDGIDQSPEMLDRARTKVAGSDAGERVTVALGDASDPRLEAAAYDVVLSRHVLWAMPDPADALARWIALLRPGGRLVLVEGSWSTGAGLTAEQTRALVAATGRPAEVTHLTDPALWGREIDDERYLVVS